MEPKKLKSPTSNLDIHVSSTLLVPAANVYCEAKIQTCPKPTWSPLGETEIIHDSQHLQWINPIKAIYKFQSLQYIRFNIFQKENENDKRHLGLATVTLAKLVGSPQLEFELKSLETNEVVGSICLFAEEEITCKEKVLLTLRGAHLDDLDTFSKSDPFLKIYRDHGGEWILIFTTEVIDDCLDPQWNPIMLEMNELCRGDPETIIKFECFDYDSDTEFELIGEGTCKAGELLIKGFNFQLINHEKQRKNKKYRNSGEIFVEDVTVTQADTFIDYIRAGMNLNLTFAIDFTASNLLPSNNNSLHYINPDPTFKNEYQNAIELIGRCLKEYDSDNKLAAFGFGGIPSWVGITSHCFPLNENDANPYVEGYEGILEAYSQCLSKITLDGPTIFNEVLQSEFRIISESDAKTYHILVIVTDGDYSDIRETARSIVEASDKPLSIIIVGVGWDFFDKLVALDSDSALLKDDRGRKATRDIVQFVQYRQYKNEPELLAKEVLKEIPKQIMNYMKQHGVQPSNLTSIV